MKTPSHYILNLALLGNTIATQQNVAITMGAILPDLPIFLFYLIVKFFYKIPESKIWSEVYYEPFWQNLVAFFHSIPLAMIGLIICLLLDWKWGTIFFISMILHSLLDLPVHHDDAHRHFFPFSNYRLISPFSYWDRNHYGRLVSLIELLLVLGVNPIVFSLLNTFYAKGIIIAIDFLYIISYLRFY